MREGDDESPDETRESRQIDAVIRGDERAFGELYRAHAPYLYRLALSMTRGVDADAEDVVQEAWRRAVGGLDDFERRSSLRVWLRAIVVRCALEKHRLNRRGEEPLQNATPTRSGELLRSSVLDLERAFERLPHGFRIVLVLHDLEGYRHTDIADLLGISEGTSKSQLSRARARMRELLGDDYERE